MRLVDILQSSQLLSIFDANISPCDVKIDASIEFGAENRDSFGSGKRLRRGLEGQSMYPRGCGGA
jgi:hypothetical protein